MKCPFVVGQRVVCVSQICAAPGHDCIETFPVVGVVYTVREIEDFGRGIGLRLAEIVNAPRIYAGDEKPAEAAWNHVAFRPAFDLSIFHKLVEEARKTKRVTVDA